MIFDTHVHLDALKRIQLPQNELVISVGYKHDANIKLPFLSEKYQVPFSVGIAPQVAMYEPFRDDHPWLRTIENLINHDMCIGIGEIGLDYKWATEEVYKNNQMKWLTAQLKIAESENLPVIIHSRKAENVLAEMLSSWKIKFVFHSFGGKVSTAKKVIDNGWIIGINPIKSREKKKVIQLGVEYLVVETDLPYIGKSFEDIIPSKYYVRQSFFYFRN